MHDKSTHVVLRGVSKTYGQLVALHPTDLEILSGEFFSLIGPSGSGKTTLLGAVAGFTPPSHGRIEIDGENIAQMPPYKRNIGMVFQNYALFPHMTVAENIAFPLRLRRRPDAEVREQVAAMLRTVRLPDVGARFPSQLSGGQQQRIALARAAIYGPRVLLMDEPLGALDKNLREEMQYEIRAFHRQIGATVLYVTHDQEEAATMSDRVAIMNAGRIVQYGSPRDLYEHPRNAFVARFLGSANLFSPVDQPQLVAAGVRVPISQGRVLKAVCGDGQSRDMPQGRSVVCVRPESISIVPADGAQTRHDDDLNRIRGQVMDATFTAGAFRYQVDAGTDEPVAVRVPSVQRQQMFAAGEMVDLAWPAASTLFIPQE